MALSPKRLLLALGLLAVLLKIYRARQRLNPGGRAVLITGCDSGLGLLTAVELAKKGFTLICTCLSEKGEAALREAVGELLSSRLTVVRCDITNPEDVEKLAQKVNEAARGKLWALINNAGLMNVGLVEWLDVADFRRVMEVNLFGAISVTKAVLPYLKARKGRIINISSVSGILAMQSAGPYNCSKFAIEAFSDTLRRELHPWGVSVHVVEPGFMKGGMTGSLNNSAVWDRQPETVKEAYGSDYFDKMVKNRTKTIEKGAHDTRVFLSEIENLLLAVYAPLRVQCGFDAKTSHVFLSLLPAEISDAILRRMAPLPTPRACAK
eukprot:TRINITY_DN1583_c0_g1_i3.p1 TRINITY_DN1583_c0_g1~~TRINITY_DN1583_c0_g1_i3.p1  ORF type:complete len:323 (+),score=82.23 TRINITY_DN1583_c0_g1_i3:3-971(+)